MMKNTLDLETKSRIPKKDIWHKTLPNSRKEEIVLKEEIQEKERQARAQLKIAQHLSGLKSGGVKRIIQVLTEQIFRTRTVVRGHVPHRITGLPKKPF